MTSFTLYFVFEHEDGSRTDTDWGIWPSREAAEAAIPEADAELRAMGFNLDDGFWSIDEIDE